MTHRCACDCAAARAVQTRRDRWVSAWGLVALVGSIVLWANVFPDAWGAWFWIPTVITWGLLMTAPVWLARRAVRRRAARPAAAVAAYRGGRRE